MAAAAIGAALLSALIHATWNALLKAGADRLAGSAAMAFWWLAAGTAMVLALPPIAPSAWPYVIASGVLHSAYWYALSKGFGVGDMSHVYTLSRGLAPAFVAVGAAFAAREIPSPPEGAGIALVCAGVLAVGASRNAPMRATAWALITAVFIASYSVNDAIGVRVSGQTWAFVGWTLISGAAPILAVALWRRGPTRLVAFVVQDWRLGFFAGLLSALGYGVILWAQTIAPIAQISALRETSVVFGALIAFAFLKERLDMRRWFGAGIVALGASVIALA